MSVQTLHLHWLEVLLEQSWHLLVGWEGLQVLWWAQGHSQHIALDRRVGPEATISLLCLYVPMLDPMSIARLDQHTTGMLGRTTAIIIVQVLHMILLE
jgi:hypothetical protein